MTSDDSDQKNSLEVPSRTWNLCYDDRYKSILRPESDKILYCCVCLEYKHLLSHCPYVSRTSDSLQKREDNFRSFDGTVRFYQSSLVAVAEISAEEIVR